MQKEITINFTTEDLTKNKDYEKVGELKMSEELLNFMAQDSWTELSACKKLH